LRTAHGAVISFYDSGDGVLFKPSVERSILKLIDDAGGRKAWLLIAEGGSYDKFSDDGLLRTHTSALGATVSYSYDANGKASAISDYTGRSIAIQYVDGRLSQITRPDGQVISYVPSSDRSITSYPDGTSKTFHFGQSNLSGTAPGFDPDYGLFTGITDERGIRYATYVYDSFWQVTEEYHGAGVQRYGFENWGSYTHVTDPLGTKRTYYFEDDPAGNRRLTTQTQPAGSGSSSGSQALSYDAQGNVASITDFTNNRTCYAYDTSRNLETTRVEGLTNAHTCATYTPAGATLPSAGRKISTQWHPDYGLALRVAEAKRLTTSVYHGQPDPFAGGAIASCAPADALLPDGKPIAVLCKRVEQATTDANGASGFNTGVQAGVAARQWQWSYNRWGQVLSEDGPRTDVADITTYTYYTDTSADHTLGDLQSITNPLGQVTQFTKYNAHGQLLESVDAKGVTTTHTYDLRMRRTSTSVGGLTTSYSYEPTGDVKRITQPDGSWVENTYDDARRIVAVTDSRGNQIVYTLDNAGNRVTERVKDPTGAPVRQINRTFDALGRLQVQSDSAFAAGGSPPGNYDTDFNFVSLLVHADGVNGSTTFADSSSFAHPIAANGSAQVSTAQSAFGGASVRFNGSTDYLSTADSPDFDLGAGDFTIEMFVRPTSVSAAYSLISQWPAAGNLGFVLYMAGANLQFSYTTDGFNQINVVAAHGMSANQWAHLAVSRSGSALRMFVNGAQIGSTYSIGTAGIYNSSGALQIGRNPNSNPTYAYAYDGHMDEIRITKGKARYLDDFTPPAQEFPNHGTVP
jgi:YD repeat-containing protein